MLKLCKLTSNCCLSKIFSSTLCEFRKVVKRKKIAISLGVLLFLGISLGVVFYFFSEEEEKKELVLYGNVDVRQVDMGFRVPGQVDTLFFEEGDYVKKGSLMAVLDKTPYDSRLRQAKGNVLAFAVKLANAEIQLKRREELIKVGGVSQEDFDNALTSRDQLRADLEQAQAEMQVAKDNLAFTETFAPADGIILTRIREPGSVVLQSEPVYTLSVVSPVWIRAYVDEPNLGNVFFGMEAEIYTDTKGKKPYLGKVGFISPVSEFTPKTVESTELRSDLVYRLRIYVANPDWGLKQVMPVTVKLALSKDRNRNLSKRVEKSTHGRL